MPVVPVNQIDSCDLGEDVRGAAHRAQAVRVACWRSIGVSSVEEHVKSDADRALRCGCPCGHPCSCVMALWPALTVCAYGGGPDGHLSRVAAHGGDAYENDYREPAPHAYLGPDRTGSPSFSHIRTIFASRNLI